MNLEIMLINSNEKNLYPKWVWCGDLSSNRRVWCGYTWFVNLLLSPVEEYGWFYVIIWYILFSILSWPMISTQYPCLYWPPTFMFSSCLFVECSKRAVVFNSTAILVSLRHIGSSGWANVSSLDWIFFLMSWCLEVPAWTSFYLF